MFQVKTGCILNCNWGQGGQGPAKNWVTWGVPSLLIEKGDKLKKGVDVEMGGCYLFYYFTVQSYSLCVWKK